MAFHDKAFWVISFFLGGVFFASFLGSWDSKFLVVGVCTGIAVVTFLLFGRRWHAILSIGIFLGAAYLFAFAARQGNVVIPFDEKISAEGVVRAVASEIERQRIVLELQAPHRGKIQITASPHPGWHYGDLVSFSGVIKQPEGKRVEYLAKEGIFGTASFPEMKLIRAGEGNPLKAALLKVKEFSLRVFQKSLPFDHAALMSGLTLGDTTSFSKEFKEAMSVTGTTHIVALSGYNILIIAHGIAFAFGRWFSRRKVFWLTTLSIILFVIMSGAEASVVRASIMAFILFLADHVARRYSFRNAIAVTAFLMVLVNPRILVWDIGFQLSFAALLGIVLLEPALRRAFRAKPAPGFLNWRKNLYTTLSAQLAVLPILLSSFGTASPLSLVSNIMILTFVPLTMTLGFVMVAMGFFSLFLAKVAGFVASIFLGYEIFVIQFFAKLPPVTIQNFSWLFGIAYYLALLGFLLYVGKKMKLYGAIKF